MRKLREVHIQDHRGPTEFASSQYFSTFPLSPISQSRSVTPAAIAAMKRAACPMKDLTWSGRLHDAGRQTRMFVVLPLVTAAVLGARTPAVAHSSFDGTWNVLFVTEAGQCGPPFRYDISIVNGVVVTSEAAAHDMSGYVDLNGNVRVSIYRAAERAVGNGRLQNNSGAGTWKGVLSAHRCSGSWQAGRH